MRNSGGASSLLTVGRGRGRTSAQVCRPTWDLRISLKQGNSHVEVEVCGLVRVAFVAAKASRSATREEGRASLPPARDPAVRAGGNVVNLRRGPLGRFCPPGSSNLRLRD